MNKMAKKMDVGLQCWWIWIYKYKPKLLVCIHVRTLSVMT